MTKAGKVETTRSTPGERSRGAILGELVREVAGPGSLTVWILAWRCKRCGHCWAIRESKGADPSGQRPSHVPKRCPVCDSPRWTRPFINQRKGRVIKTKAGKVAYGRSGKVLDIPARGVDAGPGHAGAATLEADAGSAREEE